MNLLLDFMEPLRAGYSVVFIHICWGRACPDLTTRKIGTYTLKTLQALVTSHSRAALSLHLSLHLPWAAEVEVAKAAKVAAMAIAILGATIGAAKVRAKVRSGMAIVMGTRNTSHRIHMTTHMGFRADAL